MTIVTIGLTAVAFYRAEATAKSDSGGGSQITNGKSYTIYTFYTVKGL